MENTLTYIGLTVAILGLIATILKLVLHIKQIRRENILEKRRIEADNKTKLKELRDEELKQKERANIFQASMKILSDYIEEELPKRLCNYVKEEDLKLFDNSIKEYIGSKIKEIELAKQNLKPNKSKKVEKTLSEAFGIDYSGHIFESKDLDIFLKNRAERRIKKDKAIEKV